MFQFPFDLVSVNAVLSIPFGYNTNLSTVAVSTCIKTDLKLVSDTWLKDLFNNQMASSAKNIIASILLFQFIFSNFYWFSVYR